jgi:hypothetical protein
MHGRKVIFCTAKSRSEAPGQLGKGRRAVEIRGIPPFRSMRERMGHPHTCGSFGGWPPAGIDGKLTTNQCRCRERAEPACQGPCPPRCPKARHLGHPSSVVVLTSPGTWATRQSFWDGRAWATSPQRRGNVRFQASLRVSSGCCLEGFPRCGSVSPKGLEVYLPILNNHNPVFHRNDLEKNLGIAQYVVISMVESRPRFALDE